MHFQSNNNPERVFDTLEALLVAQEEAKASGDLVKIDEVFSLTFVDETSTNNFSAE